MWKKSIGNMLMAQTIAIITIIMALFGGLLIYQQKTQSQRVLDGKAEWLVQQLSQALAEPLWKMNAVGLDTLLRSYLNDPDVLAIHVSDEKHETISYLGKHPETFEVVDFIAESSQPFPYPDAFSRQAEVLKLGSAIGIGEMTFSRRFVTNQIAAAFISTGIIFLGLVVLQSLALMVVIKQRVSTPLARLVHIARQIAAGHIDVQIAEVASRNEIGQLLVAMQEMAAKLSDVVTTVNMRAAHVASGSQSMSSVAVRMSQGTGEQAAAAEQTSAAMEEMVANIRQNADNAFQTEKIAVAAAEDARASGQAVVEALQAIRKIATKIAIIEDVARQTRMLSLNATIEAARAQAHGRGFAVVAAEVRALAERSQAAATEINGLASSSVAIAENAGDMIEKLVPHIQKTAEFVQEISAASREQDSGANQINRAIQQLNQITQQNSSISEEVASTAEVLDDHAQHLQSVIAFFKVDESGHTLFDDLQYGESGRQDSSIIPHTPGEIRQKKETRNEPPIGGHGVNPDQEHEMRDEHDDEFERY